MTTRQARAPALTVASRPAFSLVGVPTHALRVAAGVALGTSSSLDLLGQSFTVEAWVKHTHESTSPEGSTLIGSANRSLGDGTGLRLFFKAGKPVFSFARSEIISVTRITNNEWSHVAFVYRAETRETSLYINGSQGATAYAETPLSGEFELCLGRVAPETTRLVGAASPFQGELTEFRLWSCARSEGEIRSLMYAALGNFVLGLPVAPLLHHLRLVTRYGPNGVDLVDVRAPSRSLIAWDSGRFTAMPVDLCARPSSAPATALSWESLRAVLGSHLQLRQQFPGLQRSFCMRNEDSWQALQALRSEGKGCDTEIFLASPAPGGIMSTKRIFAHSLILALASPAICSLLMGDAHGARDTAAPPPVPVGGAGSAHATTPSPHPSARVPDREEEDDPGHPAAVGGLPSEKHFGMPSSPPPSSSPFSGQPPPGGVGPTGAGAGLHRSVSAFNVSPASPSSPAPAAPAGLAPPAGSPRGGEHLADLYSRGGSGSSGGGVVHTLRLETWPGSIRLENRPDPRVATPVELGVAVEALLNFCYGDDMCDLLADRSLTSLGASAPELLFQVALEADMIGAAACVLWAAVYERREPVAAAAAAPPARAPPMHQNETRQILSLARMTMAFEWRFRSTPPGAAKRWRRMVREVATKLRARLLLSLDSFGLGAAVQPSGRGSGGGVTLDAAIAKWALSEDEQLLTEDEE